MPKYKVTRKDGKTATIEAARFITDGAGTRFFDEDGGVVASFTDGALRDVMDAAITFDDPEDEVQE